MRKLSAERPVPTELVTEMGPVVAPRGGLVETHADGGFDMPRTVNLITGPSRTGDIEQTIELALPLLDAVDPEHLAGTLEALANGFVGHEDAAIKGIDRGIEALQVPLDNRGELNEGIGQLAEGRRQCGEHGDVELHARHDAATTGWGTHRGPT